MDCSENLEDKDVPYNNHGMYSIYLTLESLFLCILYEYAISKYLEHV